MSKSLKLFLKTVIISLFCGVIFFAVGYYYLTRNFETTVNEVENVPYTQVTEENKGILLIINNEETFINLDFYNKKITVCLLPENSENEKILGYPKNFTIEASEEVLIKIIDYIDGLELIINNEKIRCTGTQVLELFYENKIKDFERVIIKSIFERIAQKEIGVDFFTMIISNSTTDLKLKDCYFWSEEFAVLCKKIEFID